MCVVGDDVREREREREKERGERERSLFGVCARASRFLSRAAEKKKSCNVQAATSINELICCVHNILFALMEPVILWSVRVCDVTYYECFPGGSKHERIRHKYMIFLH